MAIMLSRIVIEAMECENTLLTKDRSEANHYLCSAKTVSHHPLSQIKTMANLVSAIQGQRTRPIPVLI
jgi:hypothetical protein